MANKVEFLNLSGKAAGKLEKEIKKTALKTLKILGAKNVSVEIFFAKPELMRFLNKKFRNKNKIANVLSFEEPKGFIFPKLKTKSIGQVYINNSKTYNLKAKSYLLIHGLLHLFGYDHKKKSDIIKMEREEQRLLKFLNLNS